MRGKYGFLDKWRKIFNFTKMLLKFSQKKRKLEKILLNLRKILLNLDKKIEKTWPKIAIFGNFGRNMVKKRKLDVNCENLKFYA